MKNTGHGSGRNEGKRYEYLECRTTAKGLISCTNYRFLRIDKLELFVIDAINQLLEEYYNPQLVQQQLDKFKSDTGIEDRVDALQKEKEIIQEKIMEKQEYYRSLYDDKVKGIISENEFILLRDGYNREVEKLENRIQFIDESIENVHDKRKKRDKREDVLNKYKHLDKLNKIIVDEFIDRIVVGEPDKETKEREITIEWNI